MLSNLEVIVYEKKSEGRQIGNLYELISGQDIFMFSCLAALPSPLVQDIQS